MENRNLTDSVELESNTCTACEEETVGAENAAAVKEAEEKPVFDKELFKRSILYNVMNMFRKNLEEATPQQIFQAASYSIRKTPRRSIICPWNFLWDEPWVII